MRKNLVLIGAISVLLCITAIRIGWFNPLDRLVFVDNGSGSIMKGEVAGINIGDPIEQAGNRLRALGVRGPYRFEKANGRFYLRRGLPTKAITYYYSDSSWRRGVIAITCIDGKRVSSVSWRMCPTCP